MNEGREEYVFLWFIENYSYCSLILNSLRSTEFFTHDLEKTSWNIQLYPRGLNDKCKGSISLFLNRIGCSGKQNIPLTFELSLLAADKSILYSRKMEKTFKMKGCWGYDEFIQMDEVLVRRRTDYLPQDCLRISCKIWRGEGSSTLPLLQITAGTRIVIQQISFIHVVKDFNALEPKVKNTFHFRKNLSSSLYFENCICGDGKITVEIEVNPLFYGILSKCKFFLLDISGEKIECGKIDNRFDVIGKCIKSLSLSLTRQEILNRKSKYMPGDILSLVCECTFSLRVEYEETEVTIFGRTCSSANRTNTEDHDNSFLGKLSACPSLLEEVKKIFNEQHLTDVVLQTKSKSFPAHKHLLCARSSVFNAMLTNNMKEKNTDCIQVNDIDDDIVQQFLLYLYSDKAEKLNWHSAIKLYYVADKYEVEKLKLLCSCFLIDNLNTSNSIELLLLADTHYDCDLKTIVEDFILKHKEEVFGSDDWGNLMETNPLLTSETMRLKYIRK